MHTEKSIQIAVAVKHMGNIAKKVQTCPFRLNCSPETARELLDACVEVCVAAYQARAEASGNPKPLTDAEYDRMQEIGKFAFGVHYNPNAVHVEKAKETALEAFTDGLVRIFIGNEEITELDIPIGIAEGDAVTFVRLTMLSGRMW